MLKKYEPPLWFDIQPSVRLNRITEMVRMLALAGCLCNALPVAAKMLLLAATYAYFAAIFKRLQNTAQYTLKYSGAAGWQVSTGADFESVRILQSTVVTPYALFLHTESRLAKAATTGAKHRALLILPDALSDDEYRRLIVKLVTNTVKQQHGSISVDKIKPIERHNTSV